MYVVIENTPGYLPDNDEPFIGSWDEACEVMDEDISMLIEYGWIVQENNGVGFRSAGGIRRTYLLPPNAGEHELGRVIEVMPYEGDES